MLEEIRNLSATPREVRKFAVTVGVAAALLLGFLFYRHKFASLWPFSVPAMLIVLGVAAPMVLKHVYLAWMALATVMQWLMTHVILTLLFYLAITPIGLINRLVRRDPLSLRFKPDAESYWIKREKAQRTLEEYERQF
ncbi:MAG: hypothetical protein D6743_20055 [Calditrichaeota bacterium]|nr:MAG: hypothetical protein D6743_20055 [Calditrichota bacterium]